MSTATVHGGRSDDAAIGRRRRPRVPPMIAACVVVFAGLVLVGAFAPYIATHEPARQDLRGRLAPPTFTLGAEGHTLGTDHLGRDVFSRVLHALRMSLGIALMGTLVGAAAGSTLGLISGMAGGRVDQLIMFFVDVQLALPFVLLALVAVAVFGTSVGVLVLVIGLSAGGPFSRMVRGQVLSAKRLPYVDATRALGGSELRLALLHVLPNVGTPLIVLASFNFTSIILLESALSFLGLGVQPPDVSLGLLIAAGREYLLTAPWIAAVPSVVLVLITMTVGLISDWLRDRFDPRTT
jgi:peptide/nickel transport system permease protein